MQEIAPTLFSPAVLIAENAGRLPAPRPDSTIPAAADTAVVTLSQQGLALSKLQDIQSSSSAGSGVDNHATDPGPVAAAARSESTEIRAFEAVARALTAPQNTLNIAV